MLNMFFMLSVTPAQWCVFILGMDTTKSDAMDPVKHLPPDADGDDANRKSKD
jgi:hypothetical protein